MSIVDPGMEAMLETFIHETDTELEQLDEIMLEAERATNISTENINLIFRLTHTIKGSAAMMGFDSISNLAHAVEDVFYLIRETPEKLNMVFNTLFDLILETSDFLKNELEKLRQSVDYEEDDPAMLIVKLHQQTAILTETQTSEAGTETQQPLLSGKNVVRFRVFFEDNCQMENMRAFMLMTQLAQYCESLDSEPRNPENDNACCADIIKNGFLILCKTTFPAEVFRVIDSALNIKYYELLDEEEAACPEIDTAEESLTDPYPEEHPDSGLSATTNKTQTAGVAAKQSLISVNQSKLDHLMDLVGEIVTAESMVAHNPDIRGLQLDHLTKSMRELRKLTDELQDIVMSIRMVPLHSTFHKMDRIVRDMSKKLDKHVEFIMEGGDTEIDKTINDAITDPFMHMIRNAMDHAIESTQERLALGKSEIGRITLSAKNVGGEIFIDVSDDGRGLDPEQLINKARDNGLLTKPENEYTEKEIFNLILLPGFSTNAQVTEFSGRGVGMDVVRKNVEQVGGTISIRSIQNQGTTFTIQIPLTLAIVEGMNIQVGDTVLTLPIISIRQSFKVNDASCVLHNTNGTEMMMLRGQCVPIYRLHQIFGITSRYTDLTEGIMIQVESGNSSACLFADELLGEYQVVVKPFPPFLNRYNLKRLGLSGCSVLGDGSISLILDINSMLGQ
ncbi:MAG: chemotaxis protein CheA [Evtepia sp.]